MKKKDITIVQFDELNEAPRPYTEYAYNTIMSILDSMSIDDDITCEVLVDKLFDIDKNVHINDTKVMARILSEFKIDDIYDDFIVKYYFKRREWIRSKNESKLLNKKNKNSTK